MDSICAIKQKLESFNGSENTNEVRMVVQQINNMTLEKQKVESDKIILRIREIEFEMKKTKFKSQTDSTKNRL